LVELQKDPRERRGVGLPGEDKVALVEGTRRAPRELEAAERCRAVVSAESALVSKSCHKRVR
jgi:hypothetical protein